MNKLLLEQLYAKYNRRQYVAPDPLQFLYRYRSNADRELVGLIASSLAYGRVAQVVKSISSVLDRIGRSPTRYLEISSVAKIRDDMSNFKHRFTTGDEMAAMLIGLKKLIKKYGAIECLFGGQMSLVEILSSFVEILCDAAGQRLPTLLPNPSKGSACKRLNLYLRWMVRKDEVDLGCWEILKPYQLVVPLDTHMHSISKCLGLTCRVVADMKTALEITEAFAKICPEDPVKYDFVLTRFGIREELCKEALYRYVMGSKYFAS